MVSTPTATGLQLARAASLGKALTHRGWMSCHEPKDNHPGAVAAVKFIRPGLRILAITLGGRLGQMIEVTAEGASTRPAEGRRRIRDEKPSWRLTCYDSPFEAIVAAAIAAAGDSRAVGFLQGTSWAASNAPGADSGGDSRRTVRGTRFTRPDGAVTATFHVPTYNPPCEHVDHCGDLGDAGGWIITGPGFAADATAHTPAAVISAFTGALPGDCSNRSATRRGVSPVDSRPAEPIPAKATAHGPRLTAVVR